MEEEQSLFAKQQATENALKILKMIPALAGLDEKSAVHCVKSFRTEAFLHGQYLITQGDEGNKFFIISSGTVDITINTTNDKGQAIELTVAQLGVWKNLGERSLITGDKTNANVIANGKVMALTLTRQVFYQCVGAKTQALLLRNLMVMDMLSDHDPPASEMTGEEQMQCVRAELNKVPVFRSLSLRQVRLLMERMTPTTYQAGAYIIRQGLYGRRFFLLGRGKVKVTLNTNEPAGRGVWQQRLLDRKLAARAERRKACDGTAARIQSLKRRA